MTIHTSRRFGSMLSPTLFLLCHNLVPRLHLNSFHRICLHQPAVSVAARSPLLYSSCLDATANAAAAADAPSLRLENLLTTHHICLPRDYVQPSYRAPLLDTFAADLAGSDSSLELYRRDAGALAFASDVMANDCEKETWRWATMNDTTSNLPSIPLSPQCLFAVLLAVESVLKGTTTAAALLVLVVPAGVVNSIALTKPTARTGEPNTTLTKSHLALRNSPSLLWV